MADIDSQLRQWSATASSNKPTGTTSIGTNLDDNLRTLQAAVRQYLASPASTIASAATVDLSTADGKQVPISGTATVTGLGTEVSGLEYLLTPTGTQVWKNSTALTLPGAADITTASGDYMLAVSKGSGNWIVPWLTKMAAGVPSGYGGLQVAGGSAQGQVKFPASQAASTNVNTLDDYEEGSFTPAVTFATPGDLAVTYSTQKGDYVKIGRQVTVSIFLDTSSFTYTTASGNLTVSGLPFAAQATGGWLGTMAYTGITLAGFTQFVPIVVGSASSIVFYGCGTGVSITNITTTHFASGGGAKTLDITLTYMASA